MHDFLSINDALPSAGQEVEVVRDYSGPVMNTTSPHFGCRYGIERTVFGGPGTFTFMCDVVSTGNVTHWRPAAPIAFENDLAPPAWLPP